MRKINSVRKLGTGTPRPPTPSVPLTELLNRRGLTGAQLLLTLATTKASTLRGCTATRATTSATATTAAAASTASATASTASTAATNDPTPRTTPTTTSTSFTASSTSPSTTLASLAFARAASPTGGSRSADLLSANELPKPLVEESFSLLTSGVAIFDLDYDAILAAKYALSVSAKGDYYLCVPPDPGIEVAALGASESALPGTTPAEALHTFMLDSRASGLTATKWEC
ncbi:unnamed protein product [Closterium sp. NIES-53]